MMWELYIPGTYVLPCYPGHEKQSITLSAKTDAKLPLGKYHISHCQVLLSIKANVISIKSLSKNKPKIKQKYPQNLYVTELYALYICG